MKTSHLIIIVAMILFAALALGLVLRGCDSPAQPKETTPATQPVTQPTQDPTVPTDPTQPTTQPALTEPTEPATEPSQGATEPTTEPATIPTEPGHVHTFQKGSTVAPSLDAAGYTVYTCPDCGYSYRGDPVAALTMQDVINSQTLKPTATGVQELDTLVQGILADITKPGDTNYQKLEAIYDYLLTRVSHGSLPIDMNDAVEFAGGKVFENVSELVVSYEAYQLLSENQGVSDHYAAAFSVLTRAVGLESYVVNGSLKGEGHVWNNVVIGGEYYAFDTYTATNPQFALADSELSGYTYSNREGAVAAQNGFRAAAEFTVVLTVTDNSGTKDHTITWSADDIRAGADSYLRNLTTIRAKGDVRYTLKIVSGGSILRLTDEKGNVQELTVGGTASGTLTAGTGYYTLRVEDAESLMHLELRIDN